MGATRSCDFTNAPGYDDFNIKFIVKMWNMVGPCIMTFVRTFFQCGSFPTTVNTTWVILISKVESDCSIDEFRRMGMVGSIYKIIPKVLARRLKSVMSVLISDNQSEFIESKSIKDSLITTQLL